MAKRHDKGEEISRGEIIAATGTLFAQRGAAVSLSDIASAAGISKGTLSYYYKSKELLTLDVARELAGRMTHVFIGLLPRITQDTSPEQARSLLAEAAFPPGEVGLFAARLFLALFHEAEMRENALREFLLQSAQKWRAALEVGVLRSRAPLSGFCMQALELLCAAAAQRIAREW